MKSIYYEYITAPLLDIKNNANDGKIFNTNSNEERFEAVAHLEMKISLPDVFFRPKLK